MKLFVAEVTFKSKEIKIEVIRFLNKEKIASKLSGLQNGKLTR